MDLTRNILKTLIYFDIFDYPITHKQLWLYYPKAISYKDFSENIKFENKNIKTKNNLFYLKNREKILSTRNNNLKYSYKKRKIAIEVAGYLNLIPTIYLIGLSGSLAMSNARRNDDIDFFIVTKKNAVWITRFLIIFLLTIIGRRRKYKDSNEKDKICVNIIIDEESLRYKKKERNIYIAHEVVQLDKIYDRNNTYYKFLHNNSWTFDYLPNIYRQKLNSKIKSSQSSKFLELIFTNTYINLFAKKIQMYFIGKHRTNEVISDKILAFHPHDYNMSILERYSNELNLFGIK